MRMTRHVATGLAAAILLAASATLAVAQDRWPEQDGEVHAEPLPEPDSRADQRAVAAPDADGDYAADPGEFQEQLHPYGEWIDHPRYGQVWLPHVQEQEPDWRPYTRGQWLLTEEHGWFWDSEEPWGWATYHYGRWFFDPQEGWLWVPGSVWGPAWVAWRESEDAIGWAPLPPDADWSPERGIIYRSGYGLDDARYAGLFVFVGASALLAPRVYRHFYPRTRSGWYFSRSRHVTSYHYDNRRIFNRGINPGLIERRTGRPLVALPVRRVDTARGAQWGGGQRSFVGVYRPDIGRRRGSEPPRLQPPTQRQPVRLPATTEPPRTAPRDRGLPRPDERGSPPWRDRGQQSAPGAGLPSARSAPPGNDAAGKDFRRPDSRPQGRVEDFRRPSERPTDRPASRLEDQRRREGLAERPQPRPQEFQRQGERRPPPRVEGSGSQGRGEQRRDPQRKSEPSKKPEAAQDGRGPGGRGPGG